MMTLAARSTSVCVADEYGAAAGGRGLRVGREIGSPAKLVDFDAGKAVYECLGLRGVSARREKAPPPASGFQPLGDRDNLADGLARTKDHLLVPLGDGPEVIDRRERQPLELQAADLADPYR